MDEVHASEEPRPSALGWVLGTVAACALFWGVLYLAYLQPLQKELAELEAAQVKAEAEIPTAQAERELARAEQQLAELEGRWDTITVEELTRQFETHSVRLLSARPGEEAGTFILEVEGGAHGVGETLPAWEKPSAPGRLPAILFVKRIKLEKAQRTRFLLEGAGRVDTSKPGRPPTGAQP